MLCHCWRQRYYETLTFRLALLVITPSVELSLEILYPIPNTHSIRPLLMSINVIDKRAIDLLALIEYKFNYLSLGGISRCNSIPTVIGLLHFLASLLENMLFIRV